MPLPPPPQEANISLSLPLSLLACSHSPDTATRIYTEKIKQRPLHLTPTPTTTTTTAQTSRRTARQHKRRPRQQPAPLSARHKRALGLYDIPKTPLDYATYEPLHRMWIGYIQEVLMLPVAGTHPVVTGAMAAKLCSADFHGAEVEVVRSRCVSRVGVRGIVVKDSKFAFEVVGKKKSQGKGRGVVKVVPKEHTVFRFTIPVPGGNDGVEVQSKEMEMQTDTQTQTQEGSNKKDLVFELHGDQFIFRAADRANKKFKSHFLPDL